VALFAIRKSKPAELSKEKSMAMVLPMSRSLQPEPAHDFPARLSTIAALAPEDRKSASKAQAA